MNETDLVNEPKKVTPEKQKTKEGKIQVDAIRSEPKLAEPGQEDIALEVLQTTGGGNSSQLETLTNEAQKSSDGEICTKNRTLETSDRGSEVSDDRRKKRKRGEQQGGDNKDKSKIEKKIKGEMVEEKNIKDEAVQRLKILQKGATNSNSEMNFSDCLYF